MDPRIEKVWHALELDDVDLALETARTLDHADHGADAALAVAVAHFEAGAVREARDRLGAIAEDELESDARYLKVWYLAQASYLLGNIEEALSQLNGLEPTDTWEKASLFWWRGLCHDHLGKTDRADELFAAAAELDPQETPRPISISPQEVRDIVHDLAQALPERLRETFEEVPVVVEDLPSMELVRNSGGAIHPDTLGLYTGSHLFERSVFDAGGLPPTIYIYRRNLERFVESREELVAEIETTLLHELGHHLGYDEDDLDQLGLA